MGDSSGERTVKEYLLEDALEKLNPVIDEQVDDEKVEQNLWEGLSLGVSVDGVDDSIDPHEIFTDGKRAESFKPTNIRFNVYTFGAAVANSVLAIGTAVSIPILVPFATLATLLSLKQATTVDIEVEDAIVYYSICEGSNGMVSRSSLEEEIESVINDTDVRVATSEPRLDESIAKLSRLDSIEVVSESEQEYYKPLVQYNVTLPPDSED